MPTDQIFISYTKKDSDFAYKLANDLEDAGFKIWIDRSIGSGEAWRQSIEENLKAAGDVIIVVSPNSMASEWVKHEGSLAYGWGKKLYPVLIAPTGSLPPWLDDYQWIDFALLPYQSAFGALVAALTPPNPIQDLLDMQVAEYEQTGDLISKTIFGVIDESYDSLRITPEAEALIQKSQKAILRERRITRIRWGAIIGLIAITSVIATLGVTGQLNRYIYRPLPIEWLEIPAGDFLMGGPESDGDALRYEFPQHPVFLETYLLARFEVTNRQYLQCIRAGVCAIPAALANDPELSDHPVVNVTRQDAEIFCSYSGGRLPTEAEWEKAARGGLENKTYPWGNEEPVCDKGERNGAQFILCEGDTAPVGSFAPNGYGLFDMAGNVWEWVADPFLPYPGGDLEASSQFGGDYGIIRGGGWGFPVSYMRTSLRSPFVLNSGHYSTGFRCARDAGP